ncbi:hypothetical protein [Pseudomonas protegens]|uniref:Putative lipoprotein n=1 Tax=Pseudomonas protegens (strain DSM 19095 / LMG 27888 / CFBP 6595 / CHA0) TaxID=1124983 RepID=A0A2C9EFL2_PSEPH|nr:hypothetical protein [Pseudomonas protegens]AGL82430.1 putative lipoprotein [Pseudomonas protegens CHA0]MBP5104614.1 hypothetical protein [Pseudomonas protegens]MBP5111358.1 hypothetical protein [Pseudomonas protegens]MBP5127485.1 hypothetical protein [Pseudomonas protegens]MBP5147032.1 hypothetical protein [Pseudomonas protegens]
MNTWAWIATLLLLSGCASQPLSKDHDQVLSEVADVVQRDSGGSGERQDLQLLVTQINSHGQLPDRLVIVAGGGVERFNVRDMFAKVSQSPNGRFLMFGANPALDKAIVGGALSGQRFPRVWLFFVGEPGQEQEMRSIVEAAGIRYSFISKYKK